MTTFDLARFDKAAKTTVFATKDIARDWQHSQASTAHLIVALFSRPGMMQAFNNAKVSDDSAQKIHSAAIGTLANAHIDPSGQEPMISGEVGVILESAQQAARDNVGNSHILWALADMGFLVADKSRINRQRDLLNAGGLEAEKDPEDQTPLEAFGIDMTEAARKGRFDPLYGRTAEVYRTLNILARRKKSNAALIGEPGVGKTAIVEGIAQAIVKGDVPEPMKNKEVIYLDLTALVAGCSAPGQLEQRIMAVLAELKERPNVILFIDELHRLVGSGGNGSQDAANMLKPALARGKLHMIGATTLKEFRNYIEKDGALSRRFLPVYVVEPGVDETIEILKELKSHYQKYHNVRYTNAALESAANLSARYITDRFLPDKAIDLIDEAGAMQKLEGKKKVDETMIAGTVSRMTGIPVDQLNDENIRNLENLTERLHERVVGQHHAVVAVANAIRRSQSGFGDFLRPLGSFLFMGPTGVGKTELAKTLAHALFGTQDALIRLDMSEYGEKHSALRMFGAPPSYVGYEEGGQLTEAVRRRPYSVVLFDEIEKAHTKIFDTLLQVLDDGHMTDGQGRKVSFKNCVLIMTSNVAPEIFKPSKTTNGALQFVPPTRARLEKALLKANFRPEFVNRLDDVLPFHPLTVNHLMRIVDIQVANVIGPVLHERSLTLNIDDTAREALVELGYRPEFGARPLKRTIQDHVQNPLSDLWIAQDIKEGDTVYLRATEDGLAMEKHK